MPSTPVKFTEAREYQLQGRLQLPGTVESSMTSRVASEIAGLVVEYPRRDGDRVAEGDLLARLNSRSLDLDLQSAEAQIRETQARMRQAESTLQRVKQLYERQVASRQQVDDAQFEFDAWLGKADNLKAEIERIRYDMSRTTITAPFNGIVVGRHTEVGQWVKVGDPVVELLSLDEVEVTINVPEQYYSDIRPGTPARIEFSALPGQEIRGPISAILPKADPQARTFAVKVRIANRGYKIGVGMLAQTSLPVGRSYRAVIVPKDAVVSRGTQRFVVSVNPEGLAEYLPVETGEGIGAWIEVKGPLKSGQRVITRGNERLQPGQPVRGEMLEYPLP